MKLKEPDKNQLKNYLRLCLAIIFIASAANIWINYKESDFSKTMEENAFNASVNSTKAIDAHLAVIHSLQLSIKNHLNLLETLLGEYNGNKKAAKEDYIKNDKNYSDQINSSTADYLAIVDLYNSQKNAYDDAKYMRQKNAQWGWVTLLLIVVSNLGAIYFSHRLITKDIRDNIQTSHPNENSSNLKDELGKANALSDKLREDNTSVQVPK
jgi:hypothetical protein